MLKQREPLMRIHINLTEAQIAALDALANELGRTRSDIIRELVEKELA